MTFWKWKNAFNLKVKRKQSGFAVIAEEKKRLTNLELRLERDGVIID